MKTILYLKDVNQFQIIFKIKRERNDGLHSSQNIFFMWYVFTISAKGKVRELTMTTVGHDKGKVNCLSRHCL